MQKLCISDFQEIIDNIKKIKKEHPDSDIAIIGEYGYAKEIVQQLIINGYDIENIEIETPELDGYEHEFIVTLDEYCQVWCERALCGTYLYNCSDYVFFIECADNTALTEHAESSFQYDVRLSHAHEDFKYHDIDSLITSIDELKDHMIKVLSEAFKEKSV